MPKHDPDPESREALRAKIAELEESEQRWCRQALSLARALNPDESQRPTVTVAMPLAQTRIAKLEAELVERRDQDEVADLVIEKLEARIAKLEAERDRLLTTQAVCHCGIYVKDHTIGDGHSPVEMPEMPDPECFDRLKDDNTRLRELLAEVTDPDDCDCNGDKTPPGTARCAVCDAMALLNRKEVEQ